MKTRSISHRNVVGAFVGGVLGILALGYIHPALLPVGCLLGVVLGYWYDLIGQTAVEQCLRTQVWLHAMFQTAPLHPFRFAREQIEKVTTEGRRILSFCLGLTFIPLWFLNLPVRLVRWTRRHEANQMIMLEIGVTSVFLGLVALAIRLILPSLIVFVSAGGKESVRGILYFVFGVWVLATSMWSFMWPILLYTGEECNSLSDKYRHYEKYSQRGRLRHSLAILGGLCLLSLAGLLFAVVLVGAFFPGIFPVGIAGLFLIAGGVGLVRGIYQAAVSQGYWVCFWVTLVITIISGALLYAFMDSHLVIWLTALTNGTLCGLVIEPVRRALAKFLERNRFTLRILMSEEDAMDMFFRIVGAALKPVWRRMEGVIDRLSRPILAS